MNRAPVVMLLLVLALVATACGGGEETTSVGGTEAAAADPTTSEATPEDAPEGTPTEAGDVAADDGAAGESDPVDPGAGDPTADATPPEPAPAGEETVEEDPAMAEGIVEFLTPDPGGDAIQFDGTIAGGSQDIYVLDVTVCCTGEAIYASVEGDVTVDVIAPDGSEFVTDQTDVEIDHDQTGEWSLVVTGDGDYSIQMGVSVNAS